MGTRRNYKNSKERRGGKKRCKDRMIKEDGKAEAKAKEKERMCGCLSLK